MSLTRTSPALVAGLSLLVACSGDEITRAPDAAPLAAPPAAVVPAATADLSGAWLWSNVEELSFPPFIALMLGIMPEGDLTRARCESSGTMTIVQTGASFDGMAEKLTNDCMTDGGQPFTQPGTTFAITDGRVTGGSIHFSFESAMVAPCPHQARITAVDDDAAVALSGRGRCVLPGHPRSQSPIQMEPPPQGSSRTTSWGASRP
jgi:hypothetical protein